jgi:hypothetical protein
MFCQQLIVATMFCLINNVLYVQPVSHSGHYVLPVTTTTTTTQSFMVSWVGWWLGWVGWVGPKYYVDTFILS